MRVIVVGAGVIGLTCAVRLAEAGYTVDVIARDLPAETTSTVAAAFWLPYLAEPRDRVYAWSKASFDEFTVLAKSVDSVVMRNGTDWTPHRDPRPWWGDAVVDLHREDDPPEGYADGWTFTTPVIEMVPYLEYLVGRLEAAGGTLTRAALSALPNHADVVVNCAGLGARLLADDHSVTPVRGQVTRVAQIGLERWTLAHDRNGDLTLVMPRTNDIVIGVTSQPGDWTLAPDPDARRAMLARAIVFEPALADAEVLSTAVGLRPARTEVRCEAVLGVDRRHLLVHCYGHGGAGVTTSWGCADEVLALVGAQAPPPTLF